MVAMRQVMCTNTAPYLMSLRMLPVRNSARSYAKKVRLAFHSIFWAPRIDANSLGARLRWRNATQVWSVGQRGALKVLIYSWSATVFQTNGFIANLLFFARLFCHRQALSGRHVSWHCWCELRAWLPWSMPKFWGWLHWLRKLFLLHCYIQMLLVWKWGRPEAQWWKEIQRLYLWCTLLLVEFKKMQS